MKGAPIHYSTAELAFIEARQSMPRVELHAAFVREFGRTDVVPDNIKALCTRKGWTTRDRWSGEEDAVLRSLYADAPTIDVARRISRSLTSTYARAQHLGLRKSEAFLTSPAAGRLTGSRGAASRFQKGSVPPNKGLRRPGFGPGSMKETQFKKGQPGWNWKPIGSERIAEGYRWTKVSDERGVPWTVNWRQTHILRWEALHGAIPKDMALKCLDADRLNPDPSNWTLIPRGLLPRLNGIFGRGYEHAPAELKPTLLAVARLEHAAAARSRKGPKRQSA